MGIFAKALARYNASGKRECMVLELAMVSGIPTHRSGGEKEELHRTQWKIAEWRGLHRKHCGLWRKGTKRTHADSTRSKQEINNPASHP